MKKTLLTISALSALLVGCAVSPPQTLNRYSNYDSVPKDEKGLWLSHQILVLGNEQVLNEYLSPNISIQKTVLPFLIQANKKREYYLNKIQKLQESLDFASSRQNYLEMWRSDIERDIARQQAIVDQYRMEGQLIMGLGALFCIGNEDCRDQLLDNAQDSGKSVGSLMKGLGGMVDNIALDMAKSHGVDIQKMQDSMKKAKKVEKEIAHYRAKAIQYNAQLQPLESQYGKEMLKMSQQCQNWLVKLPKDEKEIVCNSMLSSTKTFIRLYK